MCATVANDSLARWQESGELPELLNVLRTSLFFEQRRWRHFGEQPDARGRAYVAAILEPVRIQLST